MLLDVNVVTYPLPSDVLQLMKGYTLGTKLKSRYCESFRNLIKLRVKLTKYGKFYFKNNTNNYHFSISKFTRDLLLEYELSRFYS